MSEDKSDASRRMVEQLPRDKNGLHWAMGHRELTRGCVLPALRQWIRYVPELRQFVVRDRDTLLWDATLMADTLVAGMVGELIEQMTDLMSPRPGVRKEMLSLHTKHAVMQELRETMEVIRPLDQWDEDPSNLQTPGGVVELEWGKLRPTTVADFNLKRTSVTPDFAGMMPIAEDMLASGFAYAPEQLAYFWRILGSSLFGDNPAQTIKWLLGESGVGKSTFLLAVAHCLGDYAKVFPSSAFVRNAQEAKVSSAQDRYVLADLSQVRFALVDEVPRHGHINAVLMKQIANGTMQMVEEKYRPLRQAEVKAHVWITANHMPAMPTGDLGIERRMQITEMNGQPAVVDDTLRDKLSVEHPVLLARLIMEASKWSQYGTPPAPAASRMVVQVLVSETKLVDRWFAECWEFTGDAGHVVHSTVLWDDFRAWWTKQDEAKGRFSPEPPIGDIDFYRKLRDRIVRQIGKGDERLHNDKLMIDKKRGAGYYGLRKR